MPLAGELSTYPSGSFSYPYFTSGDLKSTRCVAFIGGLTAGLGSVPYTGRLSDALGREGWKLVQFHWGGAYDGYEHGSLEHDARDMDNLARHLASEGISDLVWMGNSTGCQDIAHFLSSRSPLNPIVKGGILQAPVSDREGLEHNDDIRKPIPREDAERILGALDMAKERIREGKGEEIWRGSGGRFTYHRLFALHGKGYVYTEQADSRGDDDYFSSDLPSAPADSNIHAHPLSTSFGRFTVPTLALWSELDEYAWSGVDEPSERMQRWAEACPASAPLSWAVIKGADHEVTKEAAQDTMNREVLKWLKGLR